MFLVPVSCASGVHNLDPSFWYEFLVPVLGRRTWVVCHGPKAGYCHSATGEQFSTHEAVLYMNSIIWTRDSVTCHTSCSGDHDHHSSWFLLCYCFWWKKLRRVELVVKLRLRATGCHLPYGIGITVLPATRHKWAHPALTPARGWYLIYLPQRDGRLSWLRWPVTYRDDLPTHRWSVSGHPSKY